MNETDNTCCSGCCTVEHDYIDEQPIVPKNIFPKNISWRTKFHLLHENETIFTWECQCGCLNQFTTTKSEIKYHPNPKLVCNGCKETVIIPLTYTEEK